MALDSGNPALSEAMEAALRWLEVQGRSRAQVEARLRKVGFSEEVADGVGRRLTELGILNDRDFALAGVRTGFRKGLSRTGVRRRLEERGVSPEDVDSALTESATDEADADRALGLARAWARTHPSETGARAFRRLGGLLLRKGYEEEVVAAVCRAVIGEPAEAFEGRSGLSAGARVD